MQRFLPVVQRGTRWFVSTSATMQDNKTGSPDYGEPSLSGIAKWLDNLYIERSEQKQSFFIRQSASADCSCPLGRQQIPTAGQRCRGSRCNRLQVHVRKCLKETVRNTSKIVVEPLDLARHEEIVDAVPDVCSAYSERHLLHERRA